MDLRHWEKTLKASRFTMVKIKVVCSRSATTVHLKEAYVIA